MYTVVYINNDNSIAVSVLTTLRVHVSALSLLCCDYYDMLAVTTATILTIVTTVSM